ncbi:hypothetical protein C8A03DRAFT_17924 [Achaetomium macrosporum]|uniref:Chitin-binding type-4 domain-containing protein n=1 Tax=Achaetomium macrosporum TaxID=79813 RepID=A0AAN7C4N8_9PEZI|nr:hypothetical protein C8A03DRAFT_17924 [Achaetomium macrosporum]
MQRIALLSSLLPLVAAHGFVNEPPARRPGSQYRATCGEQPFYQQSSDINGNIQGIQQVVGSGKTDACNLWLCKGFLLEDNRDNVQSYSLGQTIDFKVDIRAPHTGYANVSVVKTSTNTMIGSPLIEFENYASNSGVAANNTAFSVTLPNSLGGDCTTAGDCVLQWFWNAPDIDQTYEACVDFTVSGSGSGSTPTSAASSSAAATSAVATSASVPASSASAVPVTTTSSAPASEATGDEDECPADDGEEDECPADDGEEDGGDAGTGDDEDECPADDGEGETKTTAPVVSAPAVTTTRAPGAAETDAAGGAATSTITQVITSTVTTERLVTVTAPATACN